MSTSNLLALFGAMVTLAVIPSPSVCLVVARSIASGFGQGVAIALGILLGDVVFILLALYGLAALAETLHRVLVWVSYLGAGYLLWLGIVLWRVKPSAVDVEVSEESSWLANLVCGFLITIGDPKAILFYVSFFPAFVDLSQISSLETGLILAIAMIAVGGTKIVYAYLGHQARHVFKNAQARRVMNRIAGTVMIGTSLILVVKT